MKEPNVAIGQIPTYSWY